ncbi:hypothetical protein EJ07DRAFT_178112 [Lizonia empirigonia]|nr:hypothetical protein EJ07DRAFT_178112 [Lizonia empirigonia]
METISNIVSTATSTVSNVIYGQPETKTNETGGKEPVSGQMGKGTIDEPYDQGNSESALDRNTTSTASTDIEPSRVVEPTGSTQKPEDLIKAYNNEAGDSTFSNTGPGSTATGITDKAGVTDKVWKPTDVDAVNPSVADPNAAPEHGVGLESTSSPSTGKDTLWRGVDAYKDTSSTGPTSEESTSGGPKGAIDPEPKHYSIGDLTTGTETPPKSVDNTTSNSASKTSDSAVSPPDLSTTSPGTKPNYSADTHQPSGLASEKAGHGGPQSAQSGATPANHSSSISPSGDDDEKSGKLSGLKDKLKTKLHIGSKDH